MHLRSPEYYGFGAGPEVRRLHVVSEENRQQFVAWSPDAEPFVRVMREGVDLTRFDGHRRSRRSRGSHAFGYSPASANTRASSPASARLHPLKGLDNLLLAAHEVIARKPDADLRFVLAGQGSELERLRSLEPSPEDRRSRVFPRPRPGRAGPARGERPLLLSVAGRWAAERGGGSDGDGPAGDRERGRRRARADRRRARADCSSSRTTSASSFCRSRACWTTTAWRRASAHAPRNRCARSSISARAARHGKRPSRRNTTPSSGIRRGRHAEERRPSHAAARRRGRAARCR